MDMFELVTKKEIHSEYLSLKAAGLLYYLHSTPAFRHFDLCDLNGIFTDHPQTVMNTVFELQKRGYVITCKKRYTIDKWSRNNDITPSSTYHIDDSNWKENPSVGSTYHTNRKGKIL
ncbi:hypothetical protein [Jeotgalibacillus marinus]|uniref:Helix-turn-helix domain-containing protein n=1 Tax=Jeotgalibacillus marinus TaxID=86667 RepID=A0ABV3Q4Y5_9BACL